MFLAAQEKLAGIDGPSELGVKETDDQTEKKS